MRKLENKTAIVTGGSRGIGANLCTSLAAAGASVVVNYASNASAAAEVVSQIESAGGKALAVQADVAESADVRKLFDVAEETFGKVDILVNNAGVVHYKTIEDTTDDEFARIMRINVNGVFYGMREASQRLADGGRVISISTSAALMFLPTYGPYCASKGAIEQLSRSLAKELGPRRITSNIVSPGPTETEMFLGNNKEEKIDRMRKLAALGRLGKPEDMGPVIVFLASEDSGWITGQVIPVNGGTA
ncbi:Enoyl-[acyl-carrier-protein] reductase [NADPH] FabL [Bremerella volcania]|uniref:Enoyl-[acyl-carrier-protein] reductase [NADPH] FabL n=1 Tax=Bremerella volcania TaxID=2527984 RepID=A0A518C2X7_9BACT|nr:glucose 1-dehydrogenase [Bremerella volcania]QDU73586.1 Enoyl-[acyl-carrier-protein] reductase [NADPH] FabL [Bremerella volcania]